MSLKELNKLIKEFDFENSNLEQLFSNFDGLNEEIFTLVITIPKGRAIYRCRKNNQMQDLFYFEKDISYRTDLKNIKSLGRANHSFSSKFYGSLTPINVNSEEKLEGYDLSIFETSDMIRNNNEGIERYTVGMWRLKEDIKALVIIPGKYQENHSELTKDLIGRYENYRNEISLTDDQNEFTELIGKEFSKDVKNSDSNNYGISSTFAEYMLEEKFNAIVYPSVQTKKKGFNIVMNPNTADVYLKLERVVLMDLFKFRDQILLNQKSTSELKNGYPFFWEPISENISLDIESVINKFKNDNISPEYIISVLINQITKL